MDNLTLTLAVAEICEKAKSDEEKKAAVQDMLNGLFGGAEGKKSLDDDILRYLQSHPGAKPPELRDALGHRRFNQQNPLSNPVHQALVRLRNSGKIDVRGGDWGEPSFYVKAFTGKKTDKAGRENCYREGKKVPCDQAGGGTATKPAPSKPSQPKPSTPKPLQRPKQEEKPIPEAESSERRPSKPSERNKDAKPPSLKEKRKPPKPLGTTKAPLNAEGKPITGYSANGMTNTSFGDLMEMVSEQLGMRNILPEGRRSNRNVEEEGSSIDVEYDHSGYAFEIKSICIEAKEFKAKPKKDEVEDKKRFAKMHDLKDCIMIIVADAANGEAHAYWREGIGSYRLSETNYEDWNFAGTVRFAPPNKEPVQPENMA